MDNGEEAIISFLFFFFLKKRKVSRGRTHACITRGWTQRLSAEHPRILGIRFHPRVACAINIARVRTGACTCMCTHAALLHSSVSLLLMRFVRLRQVLRGRAPRWRKFQGCFVRRGSMTLALFSRKNSEAQCRTPTRGASNFRRQISWNLVIFLMDYK